ncbi:hypothetical protein NCX38_04790 [Latilactobacillus sakei]|uniref:hypothetical protein n=1 Tax=Latilactobacillus sakei TaxID=1599 RepID=UPI002030F9E3|nr:hypothetical protein [Latilactobacillus sakei]MCM1598016.1 hypothetical protein [Latilactobacillus sakei]
MSKQKIFFVNLFFFVIPYLLVVTIAAIAYDSLVVHSATWDRTIFGGLVGGILILFTKVPLERPLTIMTEQTKNPVMHGILNFFIISRSTAYKIGNFVLDFVLFCLATYLLRDFLPIQIISGSLLGWCVIAIFASISIATALGFKTLTIQQDTSVEND